MAFKTLDQIGDIRGKRVLVRVDLNVPTADGKVTDATRIERVKPTITELSDKGAKVVLLAHFGRPKGGPEAEFSLKPVAVAAADIFGRPVVFIVGGAKVSTKLDLLMNLVKKVDMLVIGGGMANTFLAARGTNVGKSLCEHDLAETAKQIMIEAASANCALVLPVDGVVAK